MIIDFRQGIVDYDTTTFPFLVSGGGSIVSLVIGTRPITLTVAQSTNNYTFTEPLNVNNAWTGLNPTGQSWLYWDFNTATLTRTFGFTTLQPFAQPSAPLNPATGQMWYNTGTFRNYVYQGGGWTEVLRVLAAEYNGNTAPPFQFISEGDKPPLPSGYANFAGTQIGVNQVNVATGFPLYDFNGVVIRQSNGTFLTTENEMFAQGAAITGVRLESNVYTAFSSDVTTIPAYGVVAVQPSGSFQLGSYNDAGNTAIAMALQNIPSGGSGAVCIEGTLTNVLWNWTGYIGQLLWISGINPGQLVTTDPHLSNPIAFPVAQPPVARVLSSGTIMFLQGIGTKGPPGTPGSGGSNVPATPTVQGVVYLSTDGGLFLNPPNTVVADGDPRLTNARLATSNSVLAATNITVAPDVPSGTTAPNVQLALQALGLNKLSLTGGTLTGNLILNADPTVPFQAATKNYVDNNFLAITAEVVEIAGSTMTGPLILSGNPTVPLQAATKQYVDNVAEGITFQAAVNAATTGPLTAIYAGNPNYTLTETSNGALVVDGVSLIVGDRVLVKNQATGSQNGVYDVTDAGSVGTPYILTRDAQELPPNSIVSGTFVFVNQGTQNNSTGWILSTANPITLDVTTLTFVQFSSAANVTYSAVITALGYTPVGPFPVSSGTGISVSGSPVSGAAPSGIVLSLSTELLGLNALSGSGFGFVQRTGIGTYVATALTASQVTTALGYIPLASRTINTTAPLNGGGALTGDLTLTIDQFTGSGPGSVPLSPGGTTAFLRADGQWAVPPGGMGGGVSSVGASTTSTGLIIGGTNPITTSGTITFNLNAELQGLAGLSTNGVVQRTGAGTYISAAYVTTLTGDVTGSGSGSFATTLATVNANVGTFGSGSNVPQFTVNAKGLITAASNVPISAAPGGSDTQVQYNAVGALAGSSNFTYAYSTGTLSLTPVAGNSFVLLLNSSSTAGGSVLNFIAPTSISSSALGLNMRFNDTGGILGYVGFETANSNNLALTLHNTRATGEIDLITVNGQLQLDQHGQVNISPPSPGYYNLQLTNNDFNLQLTPQLVNHGTSIYFGDSHGAVSSWQVDAGVTTSGNFTIKKTSGTPSSIAYSQTGEWLVNGSAGLAGQVLTSGGAGAAPSWNYGKNNDVFFATASQTVFNTTNVSTTSKTAFPSGTAYIQVFVNGVQQREDNSAGTGFSPNPTGQFYVSGGHQITFFVGLSVNDEVTLYQLY